MHLLIDGKHFVYRAFYSMPELTREGDNFPIGAIHGWCRIIWSLMNEYPSATTEIFWDAGFRARAELSADYKATRKPVPEAMKPQLPIIEKLANWMGMTSFKEPGHEADDLIASRAWQLSDAGAEVLIVSADKDFAQCVCDPSSTEASARQGKIHMLIPPPTANAKNGWMRLTPAGVIEKFGVAPEQMADLLSLMGDSSDNVIGLEGVGPKTAADWLKAYKNIEGILDNCGRLAPKSKQNLVYTSRELLMQNRQLVTLHRRELPAEIRTEGKLDGASIVAELKALHLRVCAEEAQKRYGGVTV